MNCAADDCARDATARGYCSMHYKRYWRSGDPQAVTRPQRVEIDFEDVEWMAETGESLEGAAARYGLKVQTFKGRLYRAGRGDLVQRLRPHDSVGVK